MTRPTADDVLGGRAAWAVECADALTFLRRLPDGCVDLVLFSPPYESARTYSVGFKLKGQAWVDWLRPVVVEAARVSSGLVAVNAAGQVRDSKYSPVVEWLVSDLTRLDGLAVGPSPYAWVRPGIMGSGGPYYHRRDWEPVYCLARPENLPPRSTDNTAFGRPPRWAPGGEASHRLTNGMRVNQWGRTGTSEAGGQRYPDGKRQRKSRPSHEAVTAGDDSGTPGLFGGEGEPATPVRDEWGISATTTRRRTGHGKKEKQTPAKTGPRGYADGDLATGEYKPPVIANPGNVLKTGNGGNQLGHKLAHENEAPMNLAVAERFVCWYCPVGGVVCDPFAGSGTTAHAAILHRRRFVGCDVRESQVALCGRRLRTVTPNLVGG